MDAPCCFFGCRNEDDFIYRDELEGYVRDGIVSLYTAFSRKEGVPKTYVQDLIEQNAEAVITLLASGGHLYICGDGSRMAPDVEARLLQSYQKVQGTGAREAKEWLEGLNAEGRYAKDVWTGV